MLKEFTKGLIRENPVLVLTLGLCPTLAVTTGLVNAFGMAAAMTFVLVSSNVIISLLSPLIPREVRIPCYIVVIATFVSIVDMVLKGFFPALSRSLGLFIPLIVVNCIILARAEAFASKKGVLASLLDGVGMGAGFTLALIIVSVVREVLGSWSLFGVPITFEGFESMSVLIMAPGAFLVLGVAIGVMKWTGLRAQRLKRDEAARRHLEYLRAAGGKTSA